ncbi:hypothetical protein ABEB36_004807 [Hypothenemus hampei]|uniref:Uncharacterized protein n=1 Tax=Hypothenemus hampei TaxID=57062 RepID=A0ABD1EWH8_HYPHA
MKRSRIAACVQFIKGKNTDASNQGIVVFLSQNIDQEDYMEIPVFYPEDHADMIVTIIEELKNNKVWKLSVEYRLYQTMIRSRRRWFMSSQEI